VRELLPSLEIVLAAHATDAVPQGTGNAASALGKHDITSAVIPAAEQKDFICVGDATFVVWKSTLHLTRPRARLQRPAVYFTANLAISRKALSSSHQPKEEYLTPYEPLPANVLAPLNRVSEFKGKNICLPADKITKVAPKPLKRDEGVKPIRGTTKRAFPTLPALFTRLRFSHLPDEVGASLHVEASPVIAGTFSVDRLKVEVPDADTQSNKLESASFKALQAMADPHLPMQMHAGDETVLLYKVDTEAPTTLHVTIGARVKLDQGSETKLNISWQAHLDGPAEKLAQIPYRWSRPSSGTVSHPSHLSASSIQQPASENSAEQSTTAADSGITFFFTAPETVNKDDDFLLKIKCVNNSDRPRRFMILPLEPRRPQLSHRKHPSADKKTDAEMIAGIFNAPVLQHSSKDSNVTCLTRNVQIGPLPAGASFDAQMQLRAVDTGVLDLGPLRVVDLDSKRTVDIRDLPDVVALEAEEGSKPYRIGKVLDGVKPPEDERSAAWRRKEEERVGREIADEAAGDGAS
jgi:hypothetical protein